MRPNPMPQNPGPMQIATAAQHMAKNSGHDRLGVAFQIVSLCSIGFMGLAAAVHLAKELRRDDRRRER